MVVSIELVDLLEIVALIACIGIMIMLYTTAKLIEVIERIKKK